MSNAAAVIAFLNGPDCNINETLSADSSLIKSGLLDSLVLLELALWIEAAAGVPIDLAAVEVAEEWDTPNAIQRFIETARRSAS